MNKLNTTGKIGIGATALAALSIAGLYIGSRKEESFEIPLTPEVTSPDSISGEPIVTNRSLKITVSQAKTRLLDKATWHKQLTDGSASFSRFPIKGSTDFYYHIRQDEGGFRWHSNDVFIGKVLKSERLGKLPQYQAFKTNESDQNLYAVTDLLILQKLVDRAKKSPSNELKNEALELIEQIWEGGLQNISTLKVNQQYRVEGRNYSGHRTGGLVDEERIDISPASYLERLINDMYSGEIPRSATELLKSLHSKINPLITLERINDGYFGTRNRLYNTDVKSLSELIKKISESKHFSHDDKTRAVEIYYSVCAYIVDMKHRYSEFLLKHLKNNFGDNYPVEVLNDIIDSGSLKKNSKSYFLGIIDRFQKLEEKLENRDIKEKRGK
jgi:hypothetical protein